MAALQLRGDIYRLLFRYGTKQYSLPIGPVSETEANGWKGRAEHLLMRIKQNLLAIPRGVSITDFILSDGKPPVSEAVKTAAQVTLHELREAYLVTHGNGAIEANTLNTTRIHLTHLEATLSKSFLLCGLTLTRLQGHVDRRQKLVSPITIKKELDSFRAVWNWGMRHGKTDMPFPGKGIVYPKTSEKLPFMSRDEIERRIKAGGEADALWDCLYLKAEEVTEFLAFAKERAVRAYLYPMLVMAAHTGARRSEMMRARTEDVSLAERVITLREKKRARGTTTTRRVPMSKLLAEVFTPIVQEGKGYLFGDGTQELTDGQVHKAFMTLVDGSKKWSVLKGFHVLRHAFISALANRGIDQRLIDEFCGHSTEQQRRRYRHLYPSTQATALSSVFD